MKIALVFRKSSEDIGKAFKTFGVSSYFLRLHEAVLFEEMFG